MGAVSAPVLAREVEGIYYNGTQCFVVSQEALEYVDFARRNRNEEDLRSFLEFILRWVDIREGVLKSDARRRDEILSNLWLWARLEHGCHLGDLSALFHEKIEDHEVSRTIFNSRVRAIRHYLISVDRPNKRL